MKNIDDAKKELAKFDFDDNTKSKLYALIDVEDYDRHTNARRQLVEPGKKSLPAMHRLMGSKYKVTRKAAIKVIELIAHRSSIPVAILALEDSESEIRWIAAKTLIGIGRVSIKPILEALVDKGTSYYLRQGAHHVLWELVDESDSQRLRQLVHFLKGGADVPEKIPLYASIILKPESHN